MFELDHAKQPKRFIPHFSGVLNQWVVHDAEDGHETPCKDQAAAVDRAALCEGAWRLKNAKRSRRRIAPLWEVA